VGGVRVWANNEGEQVKLCDYEMKVLRECAGERVPGLSWGAAMGAALDALSGNGLIERVGIRYEATKKGRVHVELAARRPK
jgi:hypothetical protein